MLYAKFTIRILVLLLCLLCLPAVSSCTSGPQRFGIIFTSGGDIYRIPDHTQSEVEQLTFTPKVGEYTLRVSKDGDKIIFQTGYVDFLKETSMKQRHVYLLDATSKEFVDITNVLVKYAQVWQNFSMDWSPDQKQFVMVDHIVDHEEAGSEVTSFLEFVDFDGTERKSLLIPTIGTIPSLIQSVQWSPDGKKFLLTQGVIGGIEEQLQYPSPAILIYDLESGEVQQITAYEDHCIPVAWSPTSQQIVAICSYVPPYGAEGVSGPQTVRIFDIENPGQAYERVGFSPCNDPSWSPDGKQIVFVCDKGADPVGLFIVNSDGNGVREVNLGDLGNPVVLWGPTWSPDGTQIVYVAGRDYKHTLIYSIHADGSNGYALTNREAFYRLEAVYPLP